MATATAPSVDELRCQIDDLVSHHPVVTSNRYTRWFAQGGATRGEVRHLTVQFTTCTIGPSSRAARLPAGRMHFSPAL